jgi:hypothetical protein
LGAKSEQDDVTARVDAVVKECQVNDAENVTLTYEVNLGDLMPGGDDPVETSTWRERWPVPLAEQIRRYGESAEAVLDALHDNLEDDWFRAEIVRLGAQRLIENYERCRDAMYRWSPDVRDDNMMEEAADYVCYGTSGPFFDVGALG